MALRFIVLVKRGMILYKAGEAFRFLLQEPVACFFLMIRHKQLGMVKQLGIFDLRSEEGFYGFEKMNFFIRTGKTVKDKFSIKNRPMPVTALELKLYFFQGKKWLFLHVRQLVLQRMV